MTIHSVARGVGSVVLLTALAACARQEKPAVAPSEITAAPLPPPAPAPPPSPAIGLNISPEVQEKCALHKVESLAEAPKFAFDSSLIQADEMATLQQLASCLMTGALKGGTITLVGRADPRGGHEYNVSLGERRATAVQDVLVKLGLSSAKISTSSRGEKDATGTDEQGWQLDRRVDVDVAM